MKKIMAILLVLMLAFAMVACGGGGESSKTLEQVLKVEAPDEYELFQSAFATTAGSGASVDIVGNEIILTMEDPSMDIYLGDDDMIALLESVFDSDAMFEQLEVDEMINPFYESYDIDGEIVVTLELAASTGEVIFEMSFNKDGVVE